MPISDTSRPPNGTFLPGGVAEDAPCPPPKIPSKIPMLTRATEAGERHNDGREKRPAATAGGRGVNAATPCTLMSSAITAHKTIVLSFGEFAEFGEPRWGDNLSYSVNLPS
mmetsp:Transcript_3172/g.8075  ORF Transcript_3172/g.8075 Transcript_3172/m.8075 type:complete len:111 (-) Transcript_3172:271-603(-)